MALLIGERCESVVQLSDALVFDRAALGVGVGISELDSLGWVVEMDSLFCLLQIQGEVMSYSENPGAGMADSSAALLCGVQPEECLLGCFLGLSGFEAEEQQI